MKIIAISGKIGSGKTTLANLLAQKVFELTSYKAKVINFADKLKEINYIVTGYYGYSQEEKNIFLPEYGFTVGESLQKIGTDALRNNYHQNIWVNSTLTNLDENTVYIIADCRFPNEADEVKRRGGLVLRIEGDPADVRKNSKRDMSHPSETSLDSYDFKHVIHNTKQNGIEHLEKVAKSIVENLGLD